MKYKEVAALKRKELLNILSKEIGYKQDDFKYFGEEFKAYDEFVDFQANILNTLKKEELIHIYNLLQTIRYFKPRHIDFYTTSEHFVVTGIYFTKNNKLMTYSTI